MKILVLASHCDDAELGCGGSIRKAIYEGHEVAVRIFTYWDIEETRQHAIEASNMLGVENIKVLSYPMRRFREVDGDILNFMHFLNREIKPDLVYTHSTAESHQDHQVISQESIRIFKHSSILGYNLPWNNIQETRQQVFNKLSEADIQAKCNAIKCYTTEAHRTYMSEEYQKAIAMVEGQKVGVKYAESFEVIRWIM